MPKVVTFSSDLRIFKTIAQLEDLDKSVNDFIEKNQVKTIYSVNDTTTTDDSGSTMGIIRVLAYD